MCKTIAILRITHCESCSKKIPQTGAPIADNYRASFDEVMVDEYQDISPLQEALLAAVSTTDPGDRFMVGDVKQSIDGFRLADPQLFIQNIRRLPIIRKHPPHLNGLFWQKIFARLKMFWRSPILFLARLWILKSAIWLMTTMLR